MYLVFLVAGFTFGLLIFSVVSEIYFSRKIEKELKEENFSKVYHLADCLFDLDKKWKIKTEIRQQYVNYQKDFCKKRISENDLIKMISLIPLFEKDNRKFWPIICLAREKDDQKILKALAENIQSEPWRNILISEFKKKKSAE